MHSIPRTINGLSNAVRLWTIKEANKETRVHWADF